MRLVKWGQKKLKNQTLADLQIFLDEENPLYNTIQYYNQEKGHIQNVTDKTDPRYPLKLLRQNDRKKKVLDVVALNENSKA